MLTTRLADLDARIVIIQESFERLTGRAADIADRLIIVGDAVTRIGGRIVLLEGRCEAEGIDPDINPPANDNQVTVLNYLHSDHLGRPAFATDINGDMVWDGGITTPFGVQIETLGALTQNLMFPGQYEDEETGFYYNWHRTYDPTLGRYLQSDPIGLAGGLNRYAYVGGNPVNWTDYMGLQSNEFLQCVIAPLPEGSSSGLFGRQTGGVGYCVEPVKRRFWFDTTKEYKVLKYQCTRSNGDIVTGLGPGNGNDGFGVRTKKRSGQYVNSKGQLEHRRGGSYPTGVGPFTPAPWFEDRFIPNASKCEEFPGCR